MKVKNHPVSKVGVLSLLLFVCLVPIAVSAQSNDVIDEVLEQTKLTYQNGAYLALSASGMISETDDPAEAYEVLTAQADNWKLKKLSPEKSMRLGDFSYILMRALEIKGGLFYKIFKGPRYAARELDYLGIIKEKPDPYRKISGTEAIQILGDTLEWKESQP